MLGETGQLSDLDRTDPLFDYNELLVASSQVENPKREPCFERHNISMMWQGLYPRCIKDETPRNPSPIRTKYTNSRRADQNHSKKNYIPQWASYQIRKIAGCACAGNAGNVFPRSRFQRKPLISDPGMHHGTCDTHVTWCMSGSLICGYGENVPGILGTCAPAILRIWQEAHGSPNHVVLTKPHKGRKKPQRKAQTHINSYPQNEAENT